MPETEFQRRDFLKFSGAIFSGLFWQKFGFTGVPDFNANIAVNLLPDGGLAKRALLLAPKLALNPSGLLQIVNADGEAIRELPLFRTLWNQEFCQPADQLTEKYNWGIVLHWYGDRNGAYQSIQNYLHGFDSFRLVNPAAPTLNANPSPPGELMKVTGRELDRNTPLTAPRRYRTSAHFLVGPAGQEMLAKSSPELNDTPSIIQTQAPDADGTPFIAAHVGPMNYTEPSYFLDALNKLDRQAKNDGLVLGYLLPQDFVLPDLYAHPRTPVNQRTIGIECAGFDFDGPQGMPPAQQIANLLALLCAVMKRYRISAHNILGHHELQLGKADPGKKFLACMQYLVGVKALVDKDNELQSLVFGPFSPVKDITPGAVAGYFKFLREYLSLISAPLVVYDWEKQTHYWRAFPIFSGDDPQQIELAGEWMAPMQGSLLTAGKTFLEPATHEGLDLYPQLLYDRRGSSGSGAAVRLMAAGECLFCGEEKSQHSGGLVVMRHTLPEGARILSIYGNLQQVFQLQPGQIYPAGHLLGKIEKQTPSHNPFLHLALAGDTLWHDGFSQKPALPLNAGPNWIRQRYLDPLSFLKEKRIL